MSLRIEMLQVARLAPRLLGESADLVSRFLEHQWNAGGGFKDRSGRGDLYYTVFGVSAFQALQREPFQPGLGDYLDGFGDGSGLDFVHLCSLAWCLGACRSTARPSGLDTREAGILGAIESHRTADGGYHAVAGSRNGSAYGCFLALGACQDCGGAVPRSERLVQCLKLLETPDGAWGNERGMVAGSTNATAAAVSVLRNLGMPVNQSVADWLLARAHPEGGFAAAPGAPMPDLLSTATALHALAGLEAPIDRVRESCLDFVDSLWTNEGGFHGHWADDQLDCEYTFYGLLALGHLSL
jgi:prenyltransferase beta subunit